MRTTLQVSYPLFVVLVALTLAGCASSPAPELFAERLTQCLGNADCDIAPITDRSLAEALSSNLREPGDYFRDISLVHQVSEKDRPDYDVAHDGFVRRLAQELYDIGEAKKFGYGLGLVRLSPKVALARIAYEKIDAAGLLHLNQTGFLVFWLTETGWQLMHWSRDLPGWILRNKPPGFRETDLPGGELLRLAKEVTNGAFRRGGPDLEYGVELGERACAQGLEEACKWLSQARKLGEARSLVKKKDTTGKELVKVWNLYESTCPLDPGSKVLGVVGLGMGCLYMASAARNGRGTEKNAELEKKALEKSCELGQPTACASVYSRILKDRSRSGERDKALQGLQDACSNGASAGCLGIENALGMGRMHRRRALDDEPLQMVLSAARRRCYAGNLAACNHLALIYLMGSADEAKRDIPRGIAHRVRACNYGLAASCSAMGNFHEGKQPFFGQELDYAVYYYKRACSAARPDRHGCAMAGKLMHRLPSTDMYPELLEAASASKRGCELGTKYSCTEFQKNHQSVMELYGFPLEGTPIMGGESAWVTVVVAMSAADRRWGELYYSLKGLVEKHGDEGVRVAVYPSFPGYRPVPEKLDKALLCAAKNGKYWATLEEIAEAYPKQSNSYQSFPRRSDPQVERLKQGGELVTCSTEASVPERISEIGNAIEGLKLPFKGAVFVNGRLSRVPDGGMAELEALIDTELERAKATGGERHSFYETSVMSQSTRRVDGATYGLESLEMVSAEYMESYKKLDHYWYKCNEDKRKACKSGAALAAKSIPDKASLFQTRDELLGCHKGEMDQCDALMSRTVGTKKCYELDARRQAVFHRCWFEPNHELCQSANKIAAAAASVAPCVQEFR